VVNNLYVKDLRVIKNWDLKNIAIVDNAIYSFGFQLDNGIPVLPFKEDVDDTEFVELMRYLPHLAQHDDLREANRNAFRLRKDKFFKVSSFIKYYGDGHDEASSELTGPT